MTTTCPGETRFPDLFSAIVNENPLPIPIAPQELVLFRGLSGKEKIDRQDKFFAQDFIQKHLDEKWRAELHNRSAFLWLWDLLQMEHDFDKKRQILVKMAQFRAVICRNQHPFPALVIDFRKYPFPEPQKAFPGQREMGGVPID